MSTNELEQIPRSHGRGYLILCLVLLPLVILFAFARPWGQTADFWETAAAVRAVAQDVTNPDNPMLALPGETSPRFTPFTLLWGVVMKSGLGLFTVMALAGIANFALFVTGLFRFVRGEFHSHTLPIYVLVVMLLVWGSGYGQANAYQLRVFLEQLPYVGFFTYGVCFHALAFLRRFLSVRRRKDFVGYAGLMAIAFVTHPVTAAFGFTAAAAMLIAERNWRQFVLMQGVPFISLVAALLWPYFDYWTVLTRGSSESWFEAPLFANQAQALGPALLGVPIAVYFALKRRHLQIVYGLLLCAIIYLLSFGLQVLIGSRFLLYGTIFLHLAIAVYLYEHALHRRRRLEAWVHGHGYLLIIVFVIAAPSLWYRAHEMNKHFQKVYDPPLRFHAYDSPVRGSFFLKDQLAASDIVMVDDTVGWVLPAISGAKIVAPQKGNPLISADIALRRKTTNGFFGDSLSTWQRAAIIRHYKVTHILTDDRWAGQWHATFVRDLEIMSSLQARHGALALYKVRELRDPLTIGAQGLN